MNKQVSKFLTIRETARIGILSEHHLRLLEKQGQLPGIRVGNRFKVNVDLLIDQLDRESAAQVTGQQFPERQIEAVG